MDDFLFHKVSTASISNVKNLCTALDITETDLEKALSLEPSARYEEVQVNKSDGSLRTAFKPHYLIRRIQTNGYLHHKKMNQAQFNGLTIFLDPYLIRSSTAKKSRKTISHALAGTVKLKAFSKLT